MKIRDILLPASFAFLGTYLVQHLITYFATRNEPQSVEVREGQSFVAPRKEQLIKPLRLDVEFLASDATCQNVDYLVTTERLIARYARCGAAISQLTGRSIPGVEQRDLAFVQMEQDGDPAQAAFLLALEEQTPLTYELISDVRNHEGQKIAFQAKTAACTIEKEFTFYNDSYKVDVQLTIDPHTAAGVQARLFLPSPNVHIGGAADYVQGIMFSDSHVLDRKKPAEIEGRLWVMPTLFGTEDRYFVMALVADADNFVQRAYYKSLVGTQKLAAIFEGPLVQTKKTWKLSFYCGPKQLDEMNRVDKRLEATLDYGWFAPISKVSMRVLNFVYRYVHNYGWAIVILTILIKLLLVPFSWRAEKSAKKAADMKKKLQYIEQKYKHDPEALAREKAELIKKAGLFDIGCLSIFVQLPILLALQKSLNSSIELYQAPFMGWIHDLSAIDPYYILPLLVGIGIFVHAGTAADPRQRMVTLLMALVVSGVLMNVSAGLVLFICASTWLSIVQTRIQKAVKA